MKKNIVLFLLISIFFNHFAAEETKTVKISFVRKSVKALVDGKEIFPKVGDELPITAEIECDNTGYLEFEYDRDTFRINKNTRILISSSITIGKQNSSKNIHSTLGIRDGDSVWTKKKKKAKSKD